MRRSHGVAGYDLVNLATCAIEPAVAGMGEPDLSRKGERSPDPPIRRTNRELR